MNSFLTRWGNYSRRGNYSREETIWGNTIVLVASTSRKPWVIYFVIYLVSEIIHNQGRPEKIRKKIERIYAAIKCMINLKLFITLHSQMILKEWTFYHNFYHHALHTGSFHKYHDDGLQQAVFIKKVVNFWPKQLN